MADVYSKGMVSALEDLRRRKVVHRRRGRMQRRWQPVSGASRAPVRRLPAVSRDVPGRKPTGHGLHDPSRRRHTRGGGGDRARRKCGRRHVDDEAGAAVRCADRGRRARTCSACFLVAQRFKIERIVQKCHEFLSKDISVANCVRILEFAKEHKHPSLVDMALNFISGNFNEVATTNQDFVRISYDDLKALLSSDDLNVADEGKAFSAAIKWTSADVPNRHRFLPSLLSAVRFGLCKVSFLQEEVFPASHAR
ncbi:hypothetical protein MRX96_017740 [Rhipicephalus microplus]